MATVTTTVPPKAAPAPVQDLKYVPGKGFKMVTRDKDYKKPGLNWYGWGAVMLRRHRADRSRRPLTLVERLRHTAPPPARCRAPRPQGSTSTS